MHAYATRLTGSPNDADDLTQEAFIRAIPALDRLGDSVESVRAYLFTTARNTYLQGLAEHRRELLVADVPDSADDASVDRMPEEALLLKDEQETVRSANAALPERQRLVLALRELEGLSYAQIGAMIGLGENAVAQLIFRARTALRREIRFRRLDTSRMSSDCRERLTALSALADGELDGDARTVVEAHLRGCGDCREALIALGGAEPASDFPPLPAATLVAMREQTSDALRAAGYVPSTG